MKSTKDNLNIIDWKSFTEIYKTKTGKAISDKFEDIEFSLSLDKDSHKQVLSVAKLFRLPPIRKLSFDYWDKPNPDLLEFLKNSSPSSTKIFTFGWRANTLYKPIDFYLDGLDVALKGVTQEVFMRWWTHSKESLQRVIRAGAKTTKFVIRFSKMNLDSELDFSGADYKIQVSEWDGRVSRGGLA